MNENIYIYPTDTVWGIGCNIYSEKGLIDIAKIKKTDVNKPLSILFSDLAELVEYFDFRNELDEKKMTKLMNLETTLLLPKKKLTKTLDSFIVKNSEYLSIRLLSTQFFKTLRTEIGAPFYTTSLNISGEIPVLDFKDAVKFQSQNCPSAIIKVNPNNEALSGTSSTIIKYELDNSFAVVRVGKNTSEILFYLESLNLF